MKNILNKFRIPTILGLGVIVFGIVAGVFLAVKEQTFISSAYPNVNAQNITLSNISDNSVTISWQTQTPVVSFITFGQKDPSEVTALDDRDLNPTPSGPKAHLLHYVTIKNLFPKTTYQYKIISGKVSSEISKFETAAPLPTQNGLRPVIGSVLEEDKPLDEGVVYLSLSDATTQSAPVKTAGNFLIPLSQIRKSDLSGSLPLSKDTTLKLTVLSPKGEASALFKLGDSNNGLPPIRLGENLDLTTKNMDLDKYDLNEDGKINAADNAVILLNFGPNPENKRADLNGDNVVDQKDLSLISKQINQ